MLLRASGERDNRDYALAAVTSDGLDSGVEHSRWLRTLTELTISGDWVELQSCLEEAQKEMGRQQAIDALVVAAAFNGITRVADATGIPLDENTADTTETMRASVGLNSFDYAEKSRRYG